MMNRPPVFVEGKGKNKAIEVIMNKNRGDGPRIGYKVSLPVIITKDI